MIEKVRISVDAETERVVERLATMLEQRFEDKIQRLEKRLDEVRDRILGDGRSMFEFEFRRLQEEVAGLRLRLEGHGGVPADDRGGQG